MGAGAGHEDDIWVAGYTTGAGVQVEGHWRVRASRGRTGGASRMSAAGSAGGVGTIERDRPPTPGAGVVDGPVGGGREEKVAAGLAALRHRREQLDYYAFVDRNTHHHEQWRAEVAAGTEMDPQLRAAIIDRLGDPARGRHEVHQNGGQAQPAGRSETPAGEGAGRCPDCGQFAGEQHACTPPKGLPAADYSGMDKTKRTEAMLADLESSVAAVMESGQLTRWLEAMSSNGLARWSANNRLLAAMQMLMRGRDITGLHLMGFRQWEKHQRKVLKGAKAVWILAPMTRKVLVEDENGREVERSRVVGFKSVPVFDVSDTDGEPMPSPPLAPAPGEATPGTLRGLKDRVRDAGYAYKEQVIPGCRPETGEGTLGFTEPGAKRIVIDSRLSEAQKASTIAHELGHVHCGHVDGDYGEYRRHRGRMETEAEATAYLVNRSRGMSRIDADSFSPAYIATWSRGDPKVMHAAVGKAVAASSKILDGEWPTR